MGNIAGDSYDGDKAMLADQATMTTLSTAEQRISTVRSLAGVPLYP
jgi:hypothetical protein